MLNALELLSTACSQVSVVHRNVMHSEWIYPKNVKLFTVGSYCGYESVGSRSMFWKLKSFFLFAAISVRQIRKFKPDWVILHDPNAVLTWFVARNFIGYKPSTWYHNHDVILGNENFFSYWSYRAQTQLFSTFKKFSLPSTDRSRYFPMERFRGTFLFLPNFPGLYLYSRFYKERYITTEVRLVYQGYISSDHGLEEIVELLAEGIPESNLQLRLVLKGYQDRDFIAALENKASTLGVLDRVEIHGVTGYSEVPAVASTCHIGIGIHKKNDVMTSTLGTASNKIYEYAAVGLPVVLYDNQQFRKHLGEFEWAFFTDGSSSGIRKTIIKIIQDYTRVSRKARQDFEQGLNFEKFFNKALIDF